jgi:hypothetical protein
MTQAQIAQIGCRFAGLDIEATASPEKDNA